MREKILREATKLFTERGYHGMALREVAEACGVTKPALYYHFRDKQTLFLAVLENYLEETENAINTACNQGNTAEERLAGIVSALFAQSIERRAIIRLATQETKNLDAGVRTSFGESYHRRFTGRIEAVLREGMQNEEFRPLLPGLHTWVLLGMIFPFLTSNRLPGIDAKAEDIAREIMAVFLNGIRNHQEPK